MISITPIHPPLAVFSHKYPPGALPLRGLRSRTLSHRTPAAHYTGRGFLLGSVSLFRISASAHSCHHPLQLLSIIFDRTASLLENKSVKTMKAKCGRIRRQINTYPPRDLRLRRIHLLWFPTLRSLRSSGRFLGRNSSSGASPFDWDYASPPRRHSRKRPLPGEGSLRLLISARHRRSRIVGGSEGLYRSYSQLVSTIIQESVQLLEKHLEGVNRCYANQMHF